MKKISLMAAFIAVAAIFASCEKQPTAVTPENMGSTVKLTGYVRIIKMKSDKKKDTTFVKNQEIAVLYGTQVGEKMTYRPYVATTDKKGFYSIDLGCPVGQTIDKVKVEYSAYEETYVIPKGKSDPIATDAYFYGSAEKTNLAAPQAYNLDFFVTAHDYVGGPDQNP